MREAFKKKKEKVAEANDDLVVAQQELRRAEFFLIDAKDQAKFAFLAGRRVEHVIRLFEARGCPSQDADFAIVYASALIWELGDKDTAKIEKLVSDKFSISDIPAIVRDAPPLTGAAAGKLLGVTFEEWKSLDVFMMRPTDATDEDLKAYKRAKDAARKKGRTGKTQEQRKFDEAAAMTALSELAKQHGKSVATIRRWLKSGKLQCGEKCNYGVRKNRKGYADTETAKSTLWDDGFETKQFKHRTKQATAKRPQAAPGPDAGHDVVAASRLWLRPGAPRFPNFPASIKDTLALIEHAGRAGPKVIDDLLRASASAVVAFRR